jgi:hypothetical protein
MVVGGEASRGFVDNCKIIPIYFGVARILSSGGTFTTTDRYQLIILYIIGEEGLTAFIHPIFSIKEELLDWHN